VQRAFNYGDRIGWFAVTSRADVPATEAERAALTLLRERHRIHPEDERALGHWNTEEEFSKVEGLFLGIRVLVWIVGIGTLAAGVIGVSNIMLVIVRERTREIGVRRALGATPWSIVTQVLTESVLLTFVAGYVGLIGGMALLDAVAGQLPPPGEATMFVAPGVELRAALQALAVLVVSGALAGLMPARRAVGLRPVEALRGA
jgi:putative ABC transport system permease protein